MNKKRLQVLPAILFGFAALCLLASFTMPPDDTAGPSKPIPEKIGMVDSIQSKTLATSNTPKNVSTEPKHSPEHKADSTIAEPTHEDAQKSQERDTHVVIDEQTFPRRVYKPLMIPNDPQASQWWVTNTNLDKAWDTPRGSAETVLAIIDTGFGLAHEEFAGRWYMNAGETGPATTEAASQLNCTDRGLPLDRSCNLIDDNGDGIVDNESGATTKQNPSRLNCTAQGIPLNKNCNRIDDDANGFIDDVRGWDFVNHDNSSQAGEINPTGSGTTHGTMVAGVAAATGNNGRGLAGADWGTKILPIQALDDDSYGDTNSVGRAIYYAIDRQVDVINLSLGSVSPDSYVENAVQAALSAGILVVAASGNENCDCMLYPARYPEVLAVGANGTDSQPAGFSSYGANLDMLAPGVSLTTTTWLSYNQTAAYAGGVNGTSFASPLVAGMATRILSHQPNATPLQLMAALTETSNRFNITAGVPHNTTYGHGRLDAQAATQRMTIARNPALLYSFNPVSKGNYLDSTNQHEASSSYVAHNCSQPTTRLFDLKKSSDIFFSINQTERVKAQSNGFTSSTFTWLCLSQPHDAPGNIRSLNIFQEFRNLHSVKR